MMGGKLDFTRNSTMCEVLESLITDDRGFPQYSYGLTQAVFLAKALNVKGISALELGVAGGNGLVELERISSLLQAKFDLQIDVFGFDLGEGMPPPVDYRDCPYIWKQGFFKMDQHLLRDNLTNAKLVLGDISSTGRQFVEKMLMYPIGFVSFDLDYYSSTKSALEAIILNANTNQLQPRVFCYFDDTVGPHEEIHSEYTGELLAINEFNESSLDRKFSRINGLQWKLGQLADAWVEGMFVLHLFDHDDYTKYTLGQLDRQFPLTRGLS